MSHFCNKRHHKKAFKNFRILISQEEHVRILIRIAYYKLLFLFKSNLRMKIRFILTLTNIVITNSRKLDSIIQNFKSRQREGLMTK